ncbi:MAG: hypothetical protein NTX50_28355 [Candidatus Sumerlaeota bacterium]|nr:hypothetical protein [Candidatus Sumerlaeota bacterium]
MIIGYGTSHDCGIAAVEDATGQPVFAASYERLSRQKNHSGNPSDLFMWLGKYAGASLAGMLLFNLQDDHVFRHRNGFYALESNHGYAYRWTAREAVVSVPGGCEASYLRIRTIPYRILQRRLRAQVFINGAAAGTIDNAKAHEFSLAIPPNIARVEEIAIRAEEAFTQPPDPREFGFLLERLCLIGRNAGGANLLQVFSEIETERQLWRLAHKQLWKLPLEGLRGHRTYKFLKLIHDHLKIALHGKRSLCEWLIKNIFPSSRARYDHHWCHAASAYYPSGHDRALIVSLDGMGDYYSCMVMQGEGGKLTLLKAYYYEEAPYAMNYEIVTEMLGYHALRHPGKITGLAAYGKDNPACDAAMDELYREMWATGGRRTYNYDDYRRAGPKGHTRLIEMRKQRFGQFSDADIARAIQKRTERQVCDFIGRWRDKHPDLKNIALAGGIFGNVKLNQRIKEMGFENIFIQPAMGDAGLCLGAALLGAARKNGGRLAPFQLKDVFLGIGFSPEECREALEAHGLASYECQDENEICRTTAQLIAGGKVVAHFDGRMEFGPRALGNRSILYGAGDPTVNQWLNQQLKRTEFMPFAPAVMYERASEYFENLQGAEYTAEFMTITFNCTEKARREIPAAIHVDNTARPQLVRQDRNPRFYGILKAYEAMTGIPAMINTSFNMHEEPIVATPRDAIRAFQLGSLDALVLGKYVVYGDDHKARSS